MHTGKNLQFFYSCDYHQCIDFQETLRKNLFFSLSKTWSLLLATTNEEFESKYVFWYFSDIICSWSQNLQYLFFRLDLQSGELYTKDFCYLETKVHINNFWDLIQIGSEPKCYFFREINPDSNNSLFSAPQFSGWGRKI